MTPLLHHSVEPPSLRFLIEDKPLAVLPELALWEQIRQRATDGAGAGSGRLAAFGNPDGSLPDAAREVRRLGQLWPGSLVYVGPEATLARVENLPADVSAAHFATHGYLDGT